MKEERAKKEEEEGSTTFIVGGRGDRTRTHRSNVSTQRTQVNLSDAHGRKTTRTYSMQKHKRTPFKCKRKQNGERERKRERRETQRERQTERERAYRERSTRVDQSEPSPLVEWERFAGVAPLISAAAPSGGVPSRARLDVRARAAREEEHGGVAVVVVAAHVEEVGPVTTSAMRTDP